MPREKNCVWRGGEGLGTRHKTYLWRALAAFAAARSRIARSSWNVALALKSLESTSNGLAAVSSAADGGGRRVCAGLKWFLWTSSCNMSSPRETISGISLLLTGCIVNTDVTRVPLWDPTGDEPADCPQAPHCALPSSVRNPQDEQVLSFCCLHVRRFVFLAALSLSPRSSWNVELPSTSMPPPAPLASHPTGPSATTLALFIVANVTPCGGGGTGCTPQSHMVLHTWNLDLLSPHISVAVPHESGVSPLNVNISVTTPLRFTMPSFVSYLAE